ncbi:MAG: radical SAM protein [Candidatus Aminicenantes bacterium]|nr:radical SAM protein [Candidatus Aminicenantes bacterium]NIM79396.1 radical SAM protein [Candidatus Aminicenantes bacterium]NIN18673.1 radical SAM protein [Candidatus Aminicenantes bacterium]NIN42562.1 radical SAM protein [Candidatus Aminicenantes bacterium]NIN85328.1 radical SAM protein [Candidatus Aminicenantes bacterium]
MTGISKDRAELFNKLYAIENNWHHVLYVHTPFCVQKCYYCVYSSKVPSGQEELEAFYNHVLPQQIRQYRPTLERTAFDQVYFGGGTPTIAAAQTLASIYDQVPHFKDIPVKITEASPYTVTDEHLDLFRAYGFNYVSIGVQTLSARILEAQNRKVVGKDKLIHICNRLHEYGIISNIDLIFYLDTGGLDDLEQTRSDLIEIMSEIRPVSITLHSNYMKEKTLAKQAAMMRLIKEMPEKYPEYGYRCVNALLREADIEEDTKNAAEYRLMREHEDFHFYMTPKIPQSHAYGHNMLALGTYEKFKPRYNYYYIYDYMDKYVFKSMFNKYRSIGLDFKKIREELGLSNHGYIVSDEFFKDETGKERFREIVKEGGLPYYEFNNLVSGKKGTGG